MLNSRRMRPLAGLLLLATVAAPLPGCGGGGGSSSPDKGVPVAPTGRVRIAVIWPAASRQIPTNARSVRLEVRDGATVIASSMISHPSTTGTIAEVPVGSHRVHAQAYASTDGSGVPIAKADVPVNVVDGGTATVTLTLASTVDHLEYAPNPFVVGAGLVQSLIVTARDGVGNAVLVDPGALTFSSSNPALLTVAADGTVTAGASLGTATITASDANSGKSILISSEVKVGVLVTPSSGMLNVNGSAVFVATVLGAANPAVTWSVRESGGGSVSSMGVYTAPNRRGIYHVDATSVADPTRKATATVTVTSGSIDAIIQ